MLQWIITNLEVALAAISHIVADCGLSGREVNLFSLVMLC